VSKAVFPLFPIFSLFSKNSPILFKPLDAVVALLSLGMVVLSAFVGYAKPYNGVRVSIRGEDDTWIFPLDAEETVTVAGPLGDTVVEIHGNKARVLSSPCANQTCVAQGHINAAGQWVACLPNNAFVVIESGERNGEGLDATTW
jgi:hypothetical protein